VVARGQSADVRRLPYRHRSRDEQGELDLGQTLASGYRGRPSHGHCPVNVSVHHRPDLDHGAELELGRRLARGRAPGSLEAAGKDTMVSAGNTLMADEDKTPDENPEPKAKGSQEDGAGDEQPAVATATEAGLPPNENRRWYVVKVQSGREESIKDAIERR